jgi:hypothetical protein
MINRAAYTARKDRATITSLALTWDVVEGEFEKPGRELSDWIAAAKSRDPGE